MGLRRPTKTNDLCWLGRLEVLEATTPTQKDYGYFVVGDGGGKDVWFFSCGADIVVLLFECTYAYVH